MILISDIRKWNGAMKHPKLPELKRLRTMRNHNSQPRLIDFFLDDDKHGADNHNESCKEHDNNNESMTGFCVI